MKQLKVKSIYLLASLLFPAILVSCQDDPLDFTKTYEEGLPATVTLTIATPEMDVVSRGDLVIDDTRANYCEDIWIGVYNTKTKQLVDSTTVDVSSRIEASDTNYQLDVTFDCESCNSYIVAVANTWMFKGVMGNTADESQADYIHNLLAQADTWDKFRSITTFRDHNDEELSIDELEYDMLMSGYYCAKRSDASSATIPSVDIYPGQNIFEGAIYLRHIVSYNKFSIGPANDNISVDLKSWQVVNLPARTYVTEYDGEGSLANAPSSVNEFGSTVTSRIFDYDESNSNFRDIEFYQYENKHTAVDYKETTDDYFGIRDADIKTMYSDREREFKTTNATNSQKQDNSGVYKSLLTTNDPTSLDNKATYLMFTADVSYDIAYTQENIDNPDEAEPVGDDYTGDRIHRLGEVTYIVHLGYCEGKKDGLVTRETAEDFNCRRNTKYTYTVKINGLKSLIVEATSDGDEPSPGQEGTVEDVYDNFMTMDAHYNVFNIWLSEKERDEMRWRIRAPFGWETYSFYSPDYTTAEQKESLESNPLFNWIEFAPNPDATGETLVPYPGHNEDGTRKDPDKLWLFTDLNDVTGHPNSYPTNSDGKQCYTVYINENVYSSLPSGCDDMGTSLWNSYVNVEPRTAEIISGELYVSKDNESLYMHTKYAFSQKSIQTYFQEFVGLSEALGVEHTNETLGYNWRFNTNITSGWNGNLGAYNQYVFIKNYNNSYTDGTYSWSDIVDTTKPGQIIADYGYNTFSDTGQNALLKHDAATLTMPQLVAFEENSYPVNTSTTTDGDATTIFNRRMNVDASPHNDARLFYANFACMDRNRDVNGDGVISADEMRWYLPTFMQYVQMTLGADGLEDPLIDFTEYSQDLYIKQNAGSDTSGRWNFHFFSSNNYALWAEEGLSQSAYPLTAGVYNGAQNIRCVRNLEADMEHATETTLKNSIPVIYKKSTSYTNAVEYQYITYSCYRNKVSTYLAPHTLNAQQGKVPHAFQYGKEDFNGVKLGYEQDEYGIFSFVENSYYMNCVDGTASSGSNVKGLAQRMFESARVNSICGLYYENTDKSDVGEWRMPNVKELVTMGQLGIVTQNHSWSCSHDYFRSYTNQTGQWRFYGFTNSGFANRGVCDSNGTPIPLRVRCVRDIY